MFEEERILTSERTENDEYENVLRPKTLDQYVGQQKIKKNLKIYMHSAKKERNPLTMYCYMVRRDWERPH